MKSKGIIIILCLIIIMSLAACNNKKFDYVSVKDSDTTKQPETTAPVTDKLPSETLPSGGVDLPKVEFN